MRGEPVEGREKLGGPVALAFGGLACARAWLSLAFVLPGVGLSHTWFDVGYMGLGIVLVVLGRRSGGLARRGWPYGVTLAAMLFVAAYPVLGLAFVPPSWVRGGIAVLGGVGFGLACLLNAESFVRLSLLRIVLYLTANHVVASVLVFLLSALDPLRMSVTLALLAVATVWLVRSSFEVPGAFEGGHIERPLRAYPWKLYALVALFSLAYGMRQAQMAWGAGRHSSLSTALVMGAVFLWVLHASRRFSVARATKLSMPLMVVGLLLVPLPSEWSPVVSAYCVALSFSLVTLAASIMLYDMSQRTGVSIVPLQGAYAASQITTLAGDAIVRGLPVSSEAFMIVICAVVLLSFFLLFSERELSSRWGMGILLESELPAQDDPDNLRARRCHEAAEVYGLTEREERVLETLVGTQTRHAIADELGITLGTLKTHVRHIYEKTGVHTREDLRSLVGLARE